MNLTVIAAGLWLAVVVGVLVIWRRSHRNWPGDHNPPQPSQNPSETEEGEPR